MNAAWWLFPLGVVLGWLLSDVVREYRRRKYNRIYASRHPK